MLLNLFRLDYRDILTSDTIPDMATEATTLSSSSLETSIFTIETLFVSKDNLEIDSGTYMYANSPYQKAVALRYLFVVFFWIKIINKNLKEIKALI